MADKKISQLSAATTPLAGSEVLPIVQGASTVKVSAADVTAGRAISALTYTSTVATGTAPFTVSSTTQVANLNAATAGTASNLLSNATTGVLQVTGPGAASTRVMTVPDANFTAARTDAGQTFTGVNTFTSPKVITSLDDTNGNELFKFTATASAVNELTVANAATGNRPTLSVTGNDTDIGISLQPKGTGRVFANTALVVKPASGYSVTAASKTVNVSTSATTIGFINSPYAQLALVTGLDGGDIFADLIFTTVTAGPTVLSAKTVSGSPVARTYTMGGSNEFQLAMASSTYEVACSSIYGLT
jgi:hypothetical protein